MPAKIIKIGRQCQSVRYCIFAECKPSVVFGIRSHSKELARPRNMEEDTPREALSAGLSRKICIKLRNYLRGKIGTQSRSVLIIELGTQPRISGCGFHEPK